MNEELKIIIRAELEQFKKAMKDAISGIKGVANESKKASKEIDGFTADVNQQGKALSDLKKKYVDLAAAHGTESKQAKEAAEAIKKLSAEYKTNKALAGDLANKANSFDVSLGNEDARNNVDATNESMGELQDTLQGIYTLDIWKFVGDNISKWSKKAKEFGGSAKESFDLAGIYFKQAWGELTRDPETLMDLDALGESISQSTKGSLESAKYAFQELGSAVGASFKAIAAGIAASAAIIVADLLLVIGLAKNALTMAKQIKEMSNQASKAGMTTSTFQEWGYVLKQVGIEEDKLTDFTKKLAERQNELRAGSEEVAKAFEDLGLSQEEVLGSSQEELFRKSVAGLQNIENEAERTSMAFRIFSDDATDLANVLYLTNQETQSLVDNYYSLGGAPSDNLISKSKILSGSTTNLSYAWQGLRNTLAEWVIPAVIAVVQWLTTAIAYVNAFLQGVFGIKAQSKDAAKGVENVSTGIGKIRTSANKATKAVKELLRYTMGFDELNIIPKENAGGGSGSDAGASGYSGFSGSNINPDIPVIQVPDLTKFREAMEEYGSIIQGLLTWGTILVGIGLTVAGCMTGNIPLVIAGVSLMGIGIGIGAAGGEESHWNKLWTGIKTAWNNLKNWFNQNVKPQFTLDYWKTYWGTIATAAGEKLAELKTKIDEKMEPIKKWFDDKVKPKFEKQYWLDLWENIKTATQEKLTEIKTKIDEKIKPIKDWFENKVKPLFTKQYWIDKWNNIKQAASDKLAEIKAKIDEKIKPIKDWFENKLKPIFTVDYWKQKWNTVKDGAKSAFNGVIDIVEKAVNNIIKKINTLSWDIPDWVPKIGGKKFGFDFNTVSIPRLESGGIATSSILANIGERGREAVLPLENHTEWMDTLADRVASRNATPTKIVLMVGERELGYAAINGINGITRQTGELQLALY